MVVIKIGRFVHANTRQAVGEVNHLSRRTLCRSIATSEIRNGETAARQFTQAVGVGFFVVIGGDDTGAFATRVNTVDVHLNSQFAQRDG